MLKVIAILAAIVFSWVLYIKWRAKIGTKITDELMHSLNIQAESSQKAFSQILANKGIVASNKSRALAGYLGASPCAIGYLALEAQWKIKPEVRLAFRQSGKQITGIDLLQAASGLAVKAAGNLTGADLDAVKAVVNSTVDNLVAHAQDTSEVKKIFSELWLKAFEFSDVRGSFAAEASILADTSIHAYTQVQELVRR